MNKKPPMKQVHHPVHNVPQPTENYEGSVLPVGATAPPSAAPNTAPMGDYNQ